MANEVITIENLKEFKAKMFLAVYPVGAIYMSMNSTSPATLFGGTWKQLKDRFLLGAGDTYANGKTGGEATHTLTVNEIPSHDHGMHYFHNVKNFQHGGDFTSLISNGDMNYNTLTTGGGQAHNNMPPYLVVYMWQRTA